MSITASAAAALTVSGVTTPVAVADTSDNVATYLDSLAALAASGELASITLLGSGTQVLDIPASAIVTDAQALLLITNASWNITASGTLTAVQAATVSSTLLMKLTAGLAVADTAADVASNLDGLQTHAPWIASITLTDTSNLVLGAAALSTDATALLKIAGSYTISVAGTATAAQAQAANATLLSKLSSGLTIADTAADLAADLNTLAARASSIASITLTDATPVLSLTATQLVNDASLLVKIAGSYTISVTGSATAAQAASVRSALIVHVNPGLAVADSAANVVSNLAGLQAHASWINAITLTDAAPALSLTAQQFATDPAALLKIVGSYSITVTTTATAQQAASANVSLAAHLSTGLAVQDTAANVAARLDAMQARTGTIASITLTDATPVLSITAAQLANDGSTLLKIGGSYNISVTTTASAQQAAGLRSTLASKLSAPLVVSDTAANVATYLSGLQSHATSVASITLTDTAPVLTISAAQLVMDASALLRISGSYGISLSTTATVAQVDSANATLVGKLTAGFVVLDTAANVSGSIDTLESHANSITSVALADATPVLSITAQQLISDANILLKIGGSYTIDVTGSATAQQAAAIRSTLVVKLSPGLAVSDSAANVASNLAGLQAHVSWIASIALTDASPVLSLSANQLISDATVLSKITGSYSINLTGSVTAQQAVAIPPAQLLLLTSGLDIADSAANVAANLATLQAEAAWIASITLTDSRPVLSLTAAQVLASPDALADITGSYALTVTSGTFAVSQVLDLTDNVIASLTSGVVVEDSAANIGSELDALQALGDSVGSIVLTDATPVLTLSGAQLQDDAAVLSKLSNVSLALSGPITAAQAASITPAEQAELSTGLVVSDTAANVVANLDTLQALGLSLTSITLTDAGTPTLQVSAATLVQDAGALAKIGGAWTLSITGTVTAAQAVALSATELSHLSGGIAVTDTTDGVAANLDSLEAMASYLGSIAVTGVSQVLTVSAEQLLADSDALLKLTAGCGLTVSGAVSTGEALLIDPALIALLTSGLTVADTAAGITETLSALQALGSALATITLTDTTTLSLTSPQLTSDAAVLDKISNLSAITITDNPTVGALASADATLLAKTSDLAVIDTASNVAGGLATLLSANSEIVSIHLSDTTTLNITAQELIGDAAVLDKIDDLSTIVITDNPSVSDLAGADPTLLAKTSNLAVVDTASDVAAGLSTLLSANSQIASIHLSDTTTLNITAAQLIDDAAVLTKIGNLSAITISGNTTVDELAAANTTLLGMTSDLAVIDTASNVVAGLSTLLGLTSHIASIQLSDSGTPTLAITAAQLASDGAALLLISGNYQIAITGGWLTAAQAIELDAALLPHLTTALPILDSASNVVSDLTQLEAIHGAIGSISFTDASQPILSLTPASMIAAIDVLNVASGYSISISGTFTAAQAASIAGTTAATDLATGAVVSDTAANVSANLTNLEALATAGLLGPITLTDSGTPTLSVTPDQLLNDVAVLRKISGTFTFSVSPAMSAEQAVSVNSLLVPKLPVDLAVADSAADVFTYLDQLQTLAQGGHLGSITLTDSGTPVLQVTADQLTSDATALSLITGTYQLQISGGITAAEAAAYAGNPAELAVGLKVNDSAADVVGNLTALETLATANKLTFITFTDSGTPALSLTGTQFAGGLAALATVLGSYSISVTGALTVQQLEDANTAGLLAHVSGTVAISDTSTDVLAALDTLETLTSHIGTITFTDSATTAISLTSAQLGSDADVLKVIQGLTSITLSDHPTVDQVTGADPVLKPLLTNLIIADSAANVAGSIDTLQTMQGQISQIDLSGGATALTITTAQLADTDALGKVTGLTSIMLSDHPTVAQLTGADGSVQGKLSDLAIADTSANVVAELDTLEGLASHISTISFTDTGTTSIEIATAQLSSDADVLKDIQGLTTITLSGSPTVEQLMSTDPVLQAMLSGVVISDSSSNVVNNLDTLETLHSHISSINVGAASAISTSSAQLGGDVDVLKDIEGLATITLSDSPTVAQVTGADSTLKSMLTGLNIADTAAAVAASLDTLEGLAGQINSITLSGGATTIAITAEQLVNDDTVLDKISSLATITVIDSPTVADVTGADATVKSKLTGLTIADTSANVVAALDTLEALHSQISTIAFTDSGTTSIQITPAQLSSDADVLKDIQGLTSITLSGTPTVAQVTGSDPALKPLLSDLTISDSSTNIVNSLDALEALANHISTISFNDSATAITITSAQLISDADVLKDIQGLTAINLSDSPTVAQVTGADPALKALLAGVTITDTADAVTANLDALQPLALQSQIFGITLTGGVTALTITTEQLVNDDAALNKISGLTSITVSDNPTAFDVMDANVTVQSKLTGLNIVDSSTTVLAALGALEAFAPQISTIRFSDSSTTAISISTGQLGSDAAVLKTIQGLTSITLSDNPTVAEVTGADSALKPLLTGLFIRDSSANVQAAIDTLQGLTSQINSIALSDGSPAISITASQLIADEPTLAKIATSYALTVSGPITVAQLTALPTAITDNLTAGIAISDTNTSVQQNLDWLQVHGAEVGAITLTSGTDLHMTAATLMSDLGTVLKVTNDQLFVDSGNFTAVQATTLDGDNIIPTLASAIDITDTTANLLGDLTALQDLSDNGDLGTVTATTQPLALNVTATQASQDVQAINAILGATGANPHAELFVQGTSGTDTVDASQFASVTDITLGSNSAMLSFSGSDYSASGPDNAITLGSAASMVNYAIGDGVEVINGFQFGTDVLSITLDAQQALTATDISFGGQSAILIQDATNGLSQGVILANTGITAATLTTDHMFTAGNRTLIS